MMGSHRLLGKGVMYQESVRVPLLIHLPGQTTSRRIQGPFSQIDLVPTLLELMGQIPPDHLHGTSRAALLNDGGRVEDDVFIEWHVPTPLPQRIFPDYMLEAAGSQERALTSFFDPVRTIITPEGWRFTHSPCGDHALYNLSNDPEECHNLAHHAVYKAQMQTLTARLHAWQQRVDDVNTI
jgi:arylsulfatase A-like enzyme